MNKKQTSKHQSSLIKGYNTFTPQPNFNKIKINLPSTSLCKQKRQQQLQAKHMHSLAVSCKISHLHPNLRETLFTGESDLTLSHLLL